MPDSRDDLLGVAAKIGDRLCAQADWDGGQCFWKIFASDPSKLPVRTGRWVPSGGGMYQGTAGIGLFLGELYRISRQPNHIHTALGALAHAVQWAKRSSPNTGFYSGSVGVAYALWRVGWATGRDDLVESSRGLLKLIPEEPLDDPSWDVIGGAAGAIPPLLAMAAAGEPTHELAERLGWSLVRRARVWPIGSAWSSGPLSSFKDLTGLAHGAAGAALALLELHATVTHAEFRTTAEAALDYEAALFAAAQSNWPDFRHVQLFEQRMSRGYEGLGDLVASGRLSSYRERCATAWCHGAPGIGLSRLRGHEITGSARMRREARTAAETTLRSLVDQDNYSLCHGVAGNAETLSLATLVLNDPGYELAVVAAARNGAERFEQAGVPWPGGAVDGVADASLMMGEAGIGHWYLRLARPDTPPILYMANRAARPDIADEDPTAVARGRRVDVWFGRSLRVLRGVSPTWIPPDISDTLLAVEATHTAIVRHLPTLTGRAQHLAADVFAFESAGFAAAQSHFADLTVPGLRPYSTCGLNELDWTVTRFVLAAELRVVRLEHNWAAWDSAAIPDSVTAEDPYHLLVRHGESGLVTRRLSELAALVLGTIATPGSAYEVACRIVLDLSLGSVPPPGFVDRVRQQLGAAYTAGLACVHAPGGASTEPQATAAA